MFLLTFLAITTRLTFYAQYFSRYEEVDAWIGIFRNKLQSAGIEDNTLVIFTSDHVSSINFWVEQSIYIVAY